MNIEFFQHIHSSTSCTMLNFLTNFIMELWKSQQNNVNCHTMHYSAWALTDLVNKIIQIHFGKFVGIQKIQNNKIIRIDEYIGKLHWKFWWKKRARLDSSFQFYLGIYWWWMLMEIFSLKNSPNWNCTDTSMLNLLHILKHYKTTIENRKYSIFQFL